MCHRAELKACKPYCCTYSKMKSISQWYLAGFWQRCLDVELKIFPSAVALYTPLPCQVMHCVMSKSLSKNFRTRSRAGETPTWTQLDLFFTTLLTPSSSQTCCWQKTTFTVHNSVAKQVFFPSPPLTLVFLAVHESHLF